MNLTESNFTVFNGGYYASGTPVSEADFKAILGNLEGIGFDTEYKTGPDDSAFDNATFSGFNTSSAAVPEPGVWAMMIVGMGLVGAQLRRRRTVAA